MARLRMVRCFLFRYCGNPSPTGKLLAFGDVLHESTTTCATQEALVERREHARHDAVIPFAVHDRPDL